jgi:hypothetical protein
MSTALLHDDPLLPAFINEVRTPFNVLEYSIYSYIIKEQAQLAGDAEITLCGQCAER